MPFLRIRVWSPVISPVQFWVDKHRQYVGVLHGKKFKSGSELIPPMHFNCRSILIPITKFEEFEPDNSVGKTPINDFIDENKGEGFSVK